MTDISKDAVTRYDHDYNQNCSFMSECDNGDFVSYDDYAALQARVEELEARADLPAAVTVKPLVWEEMSLNGWKRGRCAAKSAVSTGWAAYILRVKDGWEYRGNIYSSAIDGIDVALDCAKIQAQADYERSILSAITPAPDPFVSTAETYDRAMYDMENACPHCGGSGHKGDVTPAPVAGWRGMDSAPDDGSDVDLWCNGSRFENMRWNADLDCWQHRSKPMRVLYKPEAWMPLPPSPGAQPVTEGPDAVQEAINQIKPDAVHALASYQQADQEGIMVLVSRQAIEECLPALRALKGGE